MAVRSQCGFTLIEVVLAGALFAGVAWIAADAIRALAHVERSGDASRRAALALDGFVARLDAEARSALAISVSDPACGQIAFLTRDSGATRRWGYRLDGTDLLRVASAGGALPPCTTPVARDVVLSGVTSFAAAMVDGTELATHRDPLAGTADTPFVQPAGTAGDVTIPLDVADAGGAPVTSGNRIVEVVIRAGPPASGDVAARATMSRVVDLLPGTMPSAFTTVLDYTCGARCQTPVAGEATWCTAQWQTLSSAPSAWTAGPTGATASRYAAVLGLTWTYTDHAGAVTATMSGYAQVDVPASGGAYALTGTPSSVVNAYVPDPAVRGAQSRCDALDAQAGDAGGAGLYAN